MSTYSKTYLLVIIGIHCMALLNSYIMTDSYADDKPPIHLFMTTESHDSE